MSPTHNASAADDGPAIVWFRDDLRVADNPALLAAARSGRPVCCVYVFADGADGVRPPGGASRWWLHHAVADLATSLERLGSPLRILRGDPRDLVPRLAADLAAGAVYWNRRYGAAEQAVDTTLKTGLKASGIRVESFSGTLLREPWEVTSKSGGPMKVFTPYWKAARALGPPPSPEPAPRTLRPAAWPASGVMTMPLDALDLRPTKPDWADGLRAEWRPGESGASDRLAAFLDGGGLNYGDARNRPDRPSTSRLSPHLRFGEIGPRQVWHAVETARHAGRAGIGGSDLDKFLSEIGWREFSYHLLFQFPALAERNFDPRFDRFPWAEGGTGLEAWQRGRTGYPMVDAGMRQLWQTGWMHNRVRMVVGSFLVKHLLLHWSHGERWFWDTLVDADPANNAASWQWIAGSGADAAPYFRIFNPTIQGETYDPAGNYVRRYVPEIAALPDKFVHRPWAAPHPIMAAAGISYGQTYPRPIVEHDGARARALAAFKTISEGRPT